MSTSAKIDISIQFRFFCLYQLWLLVLCLVILLRGQQCSTKSFSLSSKEYKSLAYNAQLKF